MTRQTENCQGMQTEFLLGYSHPLSTFILHYSPGCVQTTEGISQNSSTATLNQLHLCTES